MANFIPSVPNFQPWYIFPNEYNAYGLPSNTTYPNIDNLVQMASGLIDTHCGRTDGDGNGSLVYTTYQERLLFQAPGRNLTLLPMKPVTAVSPTVVAALMAADIALSGNSYYTGCLANTITLQSTGQLSAIIACSGRYGYVRRDQSQTYPDLNSLINPQNLISLFGGPPPWIPVDITNLDYDPKTGEIWIPAGLQLQRYSEIIITYNSGYDPRYMPKLVKQACAAIVQNLIAKGGTTGIINQNLGRAQFNVTLGPDIIDPVIERMLRSFVAVRAY